LIAYIRTLVDEPIELRFAPWRPNDQRYYVSDTRRLRSTLELPRVLDWQIGVKALVQSFASRGTVSGPASKVIA
jgi:CDP-paratose 2-epimerase